MRVLKFQPASVQTKLAYLKCGFQGPFRRDSAAIKSGWEAPGSAFSLTAQAYLLLETHLFLASKGSGDFF
jgi:hypothetical protein